MPSPTRIGMMILAAVLGITGCAAKRGAPLLAAPAGTPPAAVRDNAEGIQAYEQGQWERAKQRFEAAIQASPDLAEAHYNLGMTLYRIGAVAEGNTHFIRAADLAPGNKTIWDSPPLKNVQVPSKSVEPSDGHFGHRH